MSLEALYKWLAFSTLLVIAGVILEGQDIWSEIKDVGLRNLKHVWAKIGFLLLVVGLLLELFFQTKIESADEALKRESNQMVEMLRTDNLRLEQQIQPRRLTPEQEKSLASLFAKFPGRTVHVSSYMQDVEGALFGEQILRAAADAGLPKDDKRMRINTFGTVVVGLSVTGTETPMVEGATVLLGSFKLVSVTNQPMQGNFMNVQEEEASFPLKIFIGAKPFPIGVP
jgi:hypothetical protein